MSNHLELYINLEIILLIVFVAVAVYYGHKHAEPKTLVFHQPNILRLPEFRSTDGEIIFPVYRHATITALPEGGWECVVHGLESQKLSDECIKAMLANGWEIV